MQTVNQLAQIEEFFIVPCLLWSLNQPAKLWSRFGSFDLHRPMDARLTVIFSSPVNSTCCWFRHLRTIDTEIPYSRAISRLLLAALASATIFNLKVDFVGMMTCTRHDFFLELRKAYWHCEWSFTTKSSTRWDTLIKLKTDQLVFIALESNTSTVS